MKEIIQKYTKDFKDIKMSENVLERMLSLMTIEMLEYMKEDTNGFYGDIGMRMYIKTIIGNIE